MALMEDSLVSRIASLQDYATYRDLNWEGSFEEYLRVVRERHGTPVDGLGMLVHQAALQVERWTGLAAPVDTMRGLRPNSRMPAVAASRKACVSATAFSGG